MNSQTMNNAANNIRVLIAEMVEKSKSGHPGGAMGAADFINVLNSSFLVYDPEDPIPSSMLSAVLKIPRVLSARVM